MNLEFVENDGQNGRHDNNRNEYNWNNRSQKVVWLMLVVSTFTPAAVGEVKLLDELEFYI